MKESKFYQEILHEGRVEGRVEAQQAAILEVLEERFGADAAAEYRDAVHQVNDAQRLSQLNRLAARCRRPSAFRRAVEKN